MEGEISLKEHNKLVRDKIPDIIKSNGQIPTIHYLSKEEYKKELDKKLQEEVAEYLKEDTIEELADICEVIEAILEYENVELKHFEAIKNKKKEYNGGFSQRIFLETTE